MITLDPLQAARDVLADYDAPRCSETTTVGRPKGPRTYQCCLPAAFEHDAHDFGPRSTAMSVEHLRVALARVDELEAQLRGPPAPSLPGCYEGAP